MSEKQYPVILKPTAGGEDPFTLVLQRLVTSTPTTTNEVGKWKRLENGELVTTEPLTVNEVIQLTECHGKGVVKFTSVYKFGAIAKKIIEHSSTVTEYGPKRLIAEINGRTNMTVEVNDSDVTIRFAGQLYHVRELLDAFDVTIERGRNFEVLNQLRPEAELDYRKWDKTFVMATVNSVTLFSPNPPAVQCVYCLSCVFNSQ